MDGRKPQGQSSGKSGKRKWIRVLFFPIAILALWFVAMVFLDIPIQKYFADHKLTRFIKETAVFFDCYNNEVPLILLAATAAISIGANRWRMIGHLILGLVITSGLVWAGKLLVSRQRPKWFTGSDWYSTFTGFFPGVSNMKFQSFPSGDAAIAFAVSFILVHYFPKHRYILYILAAGCAASRVVLKLHYLSDVIMGAAVGYLAAKIVLYLTAPSGGKG
jgi:undecaprenyl-diphosphatase